MLGAGEVKTSAGSLLARSSESKEEEVGKQPTQSRCPKLKVTDGRKERGIHPGGHCRGTVIVVFTTIPRWPHMREWSCGFQTLFLRPLGIAEGSEVPQTFINQILFL